jgi:excisionase family DNA binding protein
MRNVKYLTVEEVSQVLRLTCLTIYDYIRQGQLKAIRLGRNYRIEEESLKQFIENHTVQL